MASSTAAPAALLATILAGLPASVRTSAQQLQAWDALQPTIVQLYAYNAAHLRSQLADMDFAATWRTLLAVALQMVPLAVEAYDMELRARAGKEDDDDDEDDPHAPTRARLGSVSRIAILLKNLCAGDSAIQQQVQDALLSTSASAAGVLAAACQGQLVEETTVDFKAPLRNLLLLYANALTPAGSSPRESTAEEDTRAWAWVKTEMFPTALSAILKMSELHDLTSIATAIIHHAVLCRQPNTGYETDLNENTRRAVEELVSAENGMLHALLQPGVSAVEAQLRMLNDDRDEDQASSSASTNPPLTIWEWKPISSEPSWLLHLLDLSFRCVPGFLTPLSSTLTTEAEWNLLLRCVELVVEDGDERQEKMGKRRAKEDGSAQVNELQHTALCVAVNAVQLLEWLQRREKQPLPIVAPPAKQSEAVVDSLSADASSSSSSSAATPVAVASSSLSPTSIPIDAATNSIISLVGQILLFRVWDQTKVFQSVREALFTSSSLAVPSFLLSLLSSSDALDGGAMFSELYTRPAGHTRHTRVSEKKEDYVNQFRERQEEEEGQATGGSASSSSSAPPSLADRTPGAFARPSDQPRTTPYQFKSNLLRLIASLAFQHRGFQSAFGGPSIYACMNHSVLDSHNPLMREYAILALRNLLEGHEENQRVVAELRAQGVANHADLKEMGVETQMDEATGKIAVSTAAKLPQGRDVKMQKAEEFGQGGSGGEKEQ